jgi:uncharacterized protein YegJ (DUF2314 family)
MISVWSKRILGVITLFIGIAILSWFVYNQFYPTPEFKRSYYGLFQLFFPMACLIVGWRWFRYEGIGIEDTRPDFNCPELRESVRFAHGSMPYFLEQVEKNTDGAFIKFPILTPRGATEHIWAYVHSYRDGKFNVSLANAPYDKAQTAEGRRDVSAGEVEDWQIMYPDGRIKGAYSLIALFQNREQTGKRLTPKMKKQRAKLIDAN